MKRILAFALILLMLFSSCSTEKTIGTDYDFTETAKKTVQAVQKKFPEPVVGSTGGEWMLLNERRLPGFTASEEREAIYYENLCTLLTDSGGVLSSTKSTEYSRVILALSAMGKDVTNVAGFDLLKNGFGSMEFVAKQGLSGAVFALLALDAGKLESPEGSDVTREALIDYILENEYPEGGWAIMGTQADVDATAQALQALAAYRDDERVATAIDRALILLSERQTPEGGFYAWDGINSQTAAEMIIALTTLGIDVRTDPRFIKENGWLGSFLMEYYLGNGSFCITKGGKENDLATDACLRALISILRFDSGKSPFYDVIQNTPTNS